MQLKYLLQIKTTSFRHLITFFFDSKCFLIPEEMASHIESERNRVKKLFSPSEPSESDQIPRFIHTHLPFELLPQKLRDGSTEAKV